MHKNNNAFQDQPRGSALKMWMIALLLLTLGGLTVGCDQDDDEEDVKVETTAAVSLSAGDEAVVAKGDRSMEWETKTDPLERAFTIDLPKGWKNDTYLNRVGIVTHTIATSASPDGSDALFYGDPMMPTFLEPHAILPHQKNDPHIRAQSYTPAESFLPGYLKNRFGKLPGFQITGVSQEPELVQKNRDIAAQLNVTLTQLHSVSVAFDYKEGSSVRHGKVYGTTYSVGIVWMASVAGIVSNNDPLRYKDTLFHVLESQKMLPEWKEQERRAAADRQSQHERAMAQIAANTEQLKINHQNNMATLNGMAARHQLRMDAIHAAGDASMAAYKARDIASDNNHRGFLNYITEQNTVGTSSGRTFQVENKYERYYINKNDNSYIGLKGGTNLNDLNGVNPGDYEEAKVLR